MKILLVSPLPPPVGGMANFTLAYLEAANKQGWEIDVVNTAVIGKRSQGISSQTVFRDEIRRTGTILKNLRAALKADHYDAVHINSSCSGKGIVRDAALCRIAQKSTKVVFQCHGNIKNEIDSQKTGLWAFKSVGNHSDYVLVLNEASKRFAESQFTKRGARIALLPNFISETLVADRHSIHKEIKNVLFVGHVAAHKGVEELCKVAMDNGDMIFRLAGKKEPGLDTKQFPKNVVLLGELPHDDVVRWMDESDVLLFPTHSEGFSIVLLEAMARGLPVITTRVGANAEMLEDTGGVLVDVSDIQGMSNALKSVALPDIRKRMSDWNINKVRQKYLDHLVLQSYKRIYME